MLKNDGSSNSPKTFEEMAVIIKQVAVENILRGVANAREQVRQVTIAVKEQANRTKNISCRRNVNSQAAQVTQATKVDEGVDEVIKGGVNNESRFGSCCERAGETGSNIIQSVEKRYKANGRRATP